MRKIDPGIRAITAYDVLEAKTAQWCADKFPTVDPEETWAAFWDSCHSRGTMYVDFQAGFRTWVRKGVREFNGAGITYKEGRAADPKWIPILSEATPYGFREPLAHETPDTYRTQFNWWKDEQKKSRAPVLEFGSALRGFGK